MKNDGKSAERFFEQYWTARGHLERLRDKRDLMGLNKGKNLADFKKPADYLVSSRDCPLHYAEVKSTINPRSFQFSKIQEGQSKAALLEASRGCYAFIFYIFSFATSQWYCMTCKQYADLCREGRRSVFFEELIPWAR